MPLHSYTNGNNSTVTSSDDEYGDSDSDMSDTASETSEESSGTDSGSESDEVVSAPLHPAPKAGGCVQLSM